MRQKELAGEIIAVGPLVFHQGLPLSDHERLPQEHRQASSACRA